MPSVRVRPYRRGAAKSIPRRIVVAGAEEAVDILKTQSVVMGYTSFEQADAIRKELLRRGIRTKVVAGVGPVLTADTPWKARVLASLDLKPGVRYTRYGLQKV